MVAEKSIVLATGMGIPLAAIDPTAGGIAHKDFMFARDDEIRHHRNAEMNDALEDVHQRSPGIDDPCRAALAEIVEIIAQSRIERRHTFLVDQRSVKIKAEQGFGAQTRFHD
jgi:hypothetical protein